ncbi:MAG TPA: efflux transporter periplasmic adaptor subunit, partial [Planctomycetota bacterium]|nr:efflux transporter periplasmic adaptor subunit [Planctomycetota bacterium]
EVGDPGSLEVVVDFLSTDAVRMRPGARASLEGWGGPAPLAARVRRVEPGGFTKVSALGIEEQRVNVVLDLDEPRERWEALGDGYAVDARVVVAERSDALVAPAGTLFRRGGGWAAFVIEGGRGRVREVEVGERGAGGAEVLRGLAEGEEVVLHPGDKLFDGARVSSAEPR